MHRCERCSSAAVHWFTPERLVGYGAVLLCLACSRLTIVVSGYAAAVTCARSAFTGLQDSSGER